MVRELEYDVFIACAAGDVAVHEYLKSRLERDGLRVWRFPVIGGPHTVDDGLLESYTLLLLFSSNSLLDDVEFFYESIRTRRLRVRNRILVVLLDDEQIDETFRSFPTVDWRDRSEEGYQKIFEACRTPVDAGGLSAESSGRHPQQAEEGIIPAADEVGTEASPEAGSLTASVSGLSSSLKEEGRLTAAGVANSLIVTHGYYGGRMATTFRFAPSAGPAPRMQTIDEWLGEIRQLYDTRRLQVLRGRYVILGLSLLETSLFDEYGKTFLLTLHDEVRTPLHDVLTPRGLELLKKTPLPQPPTPPKPDTVPTLADQPVTVDALNRLPFARVLAKRIRCVRYHGKEGPFRVLLYGPWGSGKTSLLNFLRDDLIRDLSEAPDCHKEQNLESWIVVDFNAWQHQRIGPPWWSLLDAVYRTSLPQLSFLRRKWMWVSESLWRLFTGKGPAAVAIGAFAVLLLALLWVFGPRSVTLAQVGTFLKNLDTVDKLLGIGTAIVLFTLTLRRELFLNSPCAAEKMMAGSHNPLARISTHFHALIRRINRPVAIFIDDLDRCRSDYTVGLLEGIQTIFRDAPVTYVVAADRCWLCECFEHDYTQFAKAVAPPGRRLGYLFIEKTFQTVAPLPRMRQEIKAKYFSGLLGLTAEMADAEVSRRAAAIKAEIRGASTEEDFSQVVQDAGDNEFLAQIARNAIAERQVDPDMQAKQEHFLQPYGSLLEANPRAMKRLVNAYGVHRALHAIAGSNVTLERLALWTILALRWPELAEFLEHNPGRINHLDGTGDGSAEDFPEDLRPLVGYSEVENVVRGGGLGGPLSVDDVQRILLQQEVGKEPAVTKTEDAAVSTDSEGL